MALTNSEKALVINNDVSLPANFYLIFKLGMMSHAATILYNENDTTYESLVFGRKKLVDMANIVTKDPDYYFNSFLYEFVIDSNVTFATLEAKIPDVIPAIFPILAGLIRYDRP
jgi:hypothetical protein